MANSIKDSAEGVALQITKPARAAGFVEEDSENEPTYLADVRVYSFDHLLLVFNVDRVKDEHIAEVVSSAARDTKTIHQATDSSVQIAGNGYQVQLPPARDAGFVVGDTAPCHPAPGMIAITRDDGTSAAANATRLAADLVTVRRDQVQ